MDCIAPAFSDEDHQTPREDLEIVTALSSALPEDPVIVEVGCWLGRTTLELAKARPDAKIFAIDHWLGNPDDRLGGLAEQYSQPIAFSRFCSNMGDMLYDRVIPLVGYNHTYAQVWANKVDMVYIDASHRYEDVLSDIRNWYNKIKNGGILAGHDYNIFKGVDKAVDEIIPNARVKKNVWYTTITSLAR